MLCVSDSLPRGAMSLMPTRDELLAEYARTLARLEEIQREIVLAELPQSAPQPSRFKKHLAVFDGTKAAATAVAGLALGCVAFVRHHLGSTVVLAATTVGLMLTPSLAPHGTEPSLSQPPIAAPGPTFEPPPLEPRLEPPAEDAQPDTGTGVPGLNFGARNITDPPPPAETQETAPDTEPDNRRGNEPPPEEEPEPREPDEEPRDEPPPPPEPDCSIIELDVDVTRVCVLPRIGG